MTFLSAGRDRRLGMTVCNLAVIFLMVLPASFAEPVDGDRHEQMMQQLGLSQTQMQELKTIREDAMREGQALQAQARSKRQALMQYMSKPDANRETALRMHRELHDLQDRMARQRIDTWFEMRKHLSDEQVSRMSEMHERRMQMMRQRHGDRRGADRPGRE